MKKISIIVLAAVILTVGFFGYQKYQGAKFVESLTPHVKNVSLRVANSARYEADEDSKITYKELFEKLESDIQEIDRRLIEVQSISSAKTEHIASPTVVYLKASQEFLRSLLQKYRKMLKLSSAMDWSQRQLDELRAASSYSYDFAKRSSTKAIEELGEAERQYDESIPELARSVTTLKDARAKLVGIYSDDALISVLQLEKVTKKNTRPNK